MNTSGNEKQFHLIVIGATGGIIVGGGLGFIIGMNSETIMMGTIRGILYGLFAGVFLGAVLHAIKNKRTTK